MKKWISSMLLPVVAYVGLQSSPCMASEFNTQFPEQRLEQMVAETEAEKRQSPVTKKEESRDWRIGIGVTYAQPKLDEANKDVHNIESQVRQIAPGVQRFQDWGDVTKGTISLNVARRFSVYGVNVWGELIGAYGEGDIKSEQNNLSTIYGAAMDQMKFRQKYQFSQLSLGVLPELFNKRGFSANIGGFLTWGYLKADTDLDTRIYALGATRTVRGEFGEGAWGGAAVGTIKYEVLKNVLLSLQARYDWVSFKGDTRITDTQASPLGVGTTRYTQPSTSDMTGPSFTLGMQYQF